MISAPNKPWGAGFGLKHSSGGVGEDKTILLGFPRGTRKNWSGRCKAGLHSWQKTEPEQRHGGTKARDAWHVSAAQVTRESGKDEVREVGWEQITQGHNRQAKEWFLQTAKETHGCVLLGRNVIRVMLCEKSLAVAQKTDDRTPSEERRQRSCHNTPSSRQWQPDGAGLGAWALVAAGCSVGECAGRREGNSEVSGWDDSDMAC